MMSATSSGVPILPNADTSAAPARAPGALIQSALRSVSMMPGATELTVIPRLASSGETARRTPSSPALEAV